MVLVGTYRQCMLLVVLSSIGGIQRRFGNTRNFESEEFAQEIGKFVNHSDQVIFVAPYYGAPLKYYGKLSGAHWLRRVSDTGRALGRWRRQLSVEKRFSTLSIDPEYFVITYFNEFNRHHSDLREYLTDNCPLVADTDQYLIYEACKE